MIPSVLSSGVKLPADRVQTAGRDALPDALFKAQVVAVGPQGATEDLRRIVGCRLRTPRERQPSPGDHRGPEGGTALQEPAAVGGCAGRMREMRGWKLDRSSTPPWPVRPRE